MADAVVGIGWGAGDLLVVEPPAGRATTRTLVGDPTGDVPRAAPVPAIVVPGSPGADTPL